MSVYYEPENNTDGSHPTPCQSPLGHRAHGMGTVVVDGVPHCVLDARSDFGIVPWSTSWTPEGDSRTGLALIGVAAPDDAANWEGPAVASSLKNNDFSRNTIYDVALAVQDVDDARILLYLRVDANEMRNLQQAQRAIAQLLEGFTVLSRTALANSVVYWREA